MAEQEWKWKSLSSKAVVGWLWSSLYTNGALESLYFFSAKLGAQGHFLISVWPFQNFIYLCTSHWLLLRKCYSDFPRKKFHLLEYK